ncbi:hypothetical protein HPB50_008331 [Hyalomma asiaticum]|uniref:Uncharacterized protein n=1 Tax=Hyalomma asiaticum TaxID=266040 RepID=A0ACB7SX10_HYAAI|nr:hypothetical protein HPB50_008331 [Hyalomma asiaticum]
MFARVALSGHSAGGIATFRVVLATLMAWDQYKTRRRRCKPLEAKQRFRAAMSKMRLQLLRAWGRHVPSKGYQIRRFPKADLDHLVRNGQETRGTRRSRYASVCSDSVSETDFSDSTVTEGSSSKPPDELSPVKAEQDMEWNAAQPEDSRLVLTTVPGMFLASPQGDASADEGSLEDNKEEKAVIYYGEDLVVDGIGEHECMNVTPGCNYDDEFFICKCSREDPQSSRCLWCIVLDYKDPPIIPVFRFDVNIPHGTALII